MSSTSLVVLILFAMLNEMVADVPLTRTKFKAAVYGHAVIPPPLGIVSRDDALRYMMVNLEVYRVQAAEAKKQGADILVFPEDGIYGFTFTRESVYNFLENIPTPLDPEWSPCNHPDLHHDTEVLHELSCIAKNNSIYLVANMGDKQPCDTGIDPKCPPDGRYQYNTDIAFDPNGTIIARYHKYHLFFEEQFDTPDAEIVYFDTPFGRFGMMVCFDVLFLEPGLPMILKNQIANIVFPTAWMDALPLLSAIGFHSSFARSLGVNFLAADIHIPSNRMHGSGIYNPDGMKAFYYGAAPESPAKLVVAELDVMDKPRPAIDVTTSDAHFDLYDSSCDGISKSKDYVERDEFLSELFHDKFTFKILEAPNDRVRVCQKEVCCILSYTILDASFRDELFAFGAFDGLHTYEGQYYFQICTLVKCADPTNRSTCGAVTDTSTTKFTHLVIEAEMTTPFIYPQVVLSDEAGELSLTDAETWSFQTASLRTNSAPVKPLLSAALFGRHYKRDNCTNGSVSITIPYCQTALLAISRLVTGILKLFLIE